MNLMEGVFSVGDGSNLYYCDTDSIFIDKEIP